jgi:Protein of unknown function (DUF2384)
MTSTATQAAADPAAVLSKALLSAGRLLGLSQAEIGQVVGKERTSLRRNLDPNSKSGELALLLIRAYRSLHTLVGGDPALLKHWMNTGNLHTGGVPREQVKTVQGLNQVVEYLDAIRAKI